MSNNVLLARYQMAAVLHEQHCLDPGFSQSHLANTTEHNNKKNRKTYIIVILNKTSLIEF